MEGFHAPSIADKSLYSQAFLNLFECEEVIHIIGHWRQRYFWSARDAKIGPIASCRKRKSGVF